MRSPVAIFDFDGTIADSLAVVVSVYNEAAPRLRIPLLTPENSHGLRRMNPAEALKASGIPLWKVPLIMNAVRSGMRAHSETLAPFPGMSEALADLRAAGCGCCILSSNARENIEPFLARPPDAALRSLLVRREYVRQGGAASKVGEELGTERVGGLLHR
jgi:phosphoglycolate phosphatase